MPVRKDFFRLSTWLPRVAFGLVLLLSAGAAGAQIRTVLVSPVPGNPVASGTALLNALAAIASPSATNSWLLKIEPGLYDVGSTTLQMRSWVDIEGSGIGVTTIRGSVPQAGVFAATVQGANDAELRLLTVEAVGNGAAPDVIAMGNYNASSRMYRVRFSAVGGSAWGVRNVNTAPQIEECEIAVTSTSAVGTNAYGIVLRGFPSVASRSSISGSKIVVSGAMENEGVSLVNGEIATEIRNSRIEVSDGQTARGIHVSSGWQQETLEIRNTDIIASGSSSASYGIQAGSDIDFPLEVIGSKVWAIGSPTTYGIYFLGLAPVTVQESSVVGFTQTIFTTDGATISSTVLQGGPASPLETVAPAQSVDVVGNGDAGIGTAVPAERLHVFENADANSLIVIENPNPGTGAAGVLRAKSDAALTSLIAHGSGRTLSRFGQTLGSWNELLQVNGNGLILGTVSSKPLILGTNSTNRFHITGTGSIGVGTSAPASLFHVSGGDIRVSGGSFIDDGVTLNTPDYVFEPDYSLKPLTELKEFIDREKHLPNIPSAAEVKANGVRLGQFQMLLLEKVEELTLYTIDQDEEIRRLHARNAELEKHLEDRLATLERALGLQTAGSPE